MNIQTPTDPEVAAEQAYIDHAYECLEAMRKDTARALASEAVANAAARRALQQVLEARLADLEEEGSLVFGRIDEQVGETYYIGRRHVRDQRLDPVVVDWRAPVAEAFYQATEGEDWVLSGDACS